MVVAPGSPELLQGDRAADAFIQQDDALSAERGRISFGDSPPAKESVQQSLLHLSFQRRLMSHPAAGVSGPKEFRKNG